MLNRISERTGHLAAIYALHPATDGFYTAGADGYVVHWHREDVNFGRVVAKVDGGKIFSLATLPDGGFVAGALDGGVHWLYPDEPERNKHVAQHRLPVYATLRLGNDLYTAGGDGVLTRWDVGRQRTVSSTQVSQNSLRCIAPYGEDRLLVGASDGMVHVVERNGLDVSKRLPANEPSTFTVAAFSGENGKAHCVSGGRDARLLFYELSTGNPANPGPIDAHNSTINALAFSPDGRYLATASRDKTVKLWLAADRSFKLLKVAEVVRDRGHVNSVNVLCWLDDATLLTAGDDRRILEWQVG